MSDAKLGQISMVDRDYASMRDALIKRIPLITDRWTDWNESDLGMTLLELFCGAGDLLTFYLDKQANETYLPTVKQLRNAIALCKLVGYQLSNPVPATTTMRYELDAPLGADLTIPVWTVCKTAESSDAIPFVNPQLVIIPAGQISATGLAIQGRRFTDKFTSDGKPDQGLLLTKSPVAQSIPKNLHRWPQALYAVEVTVNGEPWEQVATWYDSDGASQHFQVETDHEGKTRIVFGDGFFGTVPVAGASIAVSYLVTKGAAGNVRSGLVTKREGTIKLGSQVVNVRVTNTAAATGGTDRESIATARKLAPASIRAGWRLVTVPDYENELRENFPGLANVTALTAEECANMPYSRVVVFVKSADGGQLARGLLDEIRSFIEARKVRGTEVLLFDETVTPITFVTEEP